MKNFIAVFTFVFVVILESNNLIVSAMTEAQLNAAGKLIRNMCQPKSKATDEQLEATRKGNFDGNKKVMCYIDCCYQTFKVMKNGQLDYDAAVAQIEQMPEDRKEGLRVSFSHCKDKAVGEQKCEASYNFAKCLYTDNPANFLLP